jgi:signal transduction histidine kinase
VAVEPGLAVDADQARLRELLDALLDNAVRYTPRGGRVVLEGRRSGGQAVLEVRDSGPGFAAGELDQVLEPFFRGQAAARSGASGSGLGLAVVRALARAEGGTLELGAAAEGGARVSLTLPAAVPPREEPGRR